MTLYSGFVIPYFLSYFGPNFMKKGAQGTIELMSESIADQKSEFFRDLYEFSEPTNQFRWFFPKVVTLAVDFNYSREADLLARFKRLSQLCERNAMTRRVKEFTFYTRAEKPVPLALEPPKYTPPPAAGGRTYRRFKSPRVMSRKGRNSSKVRGG